MAMVFTHRAGAGHLFSPMKTKQAAATATKKKPSTKGKAAKQPKAVKIRRSTLQSIGFKPGERTVTIQSARIDQIGRTFLRLGLVDDPDEWWMREVRFMCNGLLHEFKVVGCGARDFRVRLYQGKSEFARWLEEHPADHPERICAVSFSMPFDELEAAFKHSNRRGITSFEDFVNDILRTAMAAEKTSNAGGAR